MTNSDAPSQAKVSWPGAELWDGSAQDYNLPAEYSTNIPISLDLLWNRQYFNFEHFISGSPYNDYDKDIKPSSSHHENTNDVLGASTKAEGAKQHFSSGSVENKDFWQKIMIGAKQRDRIREDIMAWAFDFSPSRRISIEEFKKQYANDNNTGGDAGSIFKRFLYFLN